MRRHVLVVLLLGCAAPALPHLAGAQDREEIPAALARMAEAERAFSARAAETNWRDAFIEFFADEAVSFQGGPGPARERLRQVPAPKPGTPAFQWEPRTGDIAASGDLGYLTGPVRYPPGPDGRERHGLYFSIWKRQPDGTFKVILDIGVQPPAAVPFAPGFVRAASRATGTPGASRTAAERSLIEADRAFSAALAQGPAAAFEAFMHPAARLHRHGTLPPTSRAEAARWIGQHVTAMTSEPLKSETGASGDLGYTWGRATVTGPDGKPQDGYYVRVWTLGDGGRWQLVADITPA